MEQVWAQIDDFQDLAAKVSDWAFSLLPNVATAIFVLIVAWILAGWARRVVSRMLGRVATINPALPNILGSVARYGVLIVAGVIVLGELGIQTTSILAVLGAAGLAIGLALQGTLSNIAAGIMFLLLRPFDIGDNIEGGGVAGTVEELNLFHTQIRTADGVFKFVPNSQLWNTIITNYTRNPTRMVRLDIGIAYDDDLAEGLRLLTDLAAETPQVLDDPAPVTVPLRLDDSSVVLQLRAWARVDDFWETRWRLTQEGKKRLEGAGFTIPFPQRTVHYVPEKAGAETTDGAPDQGKGK